MTTTGPSRGVAPSGYVKSVLAPAAKSGVVPDAFARYGLDPEEDDDRAIATQVAAIVAIWNKSLDNPVYRDVVRQLKNEHAVVGQQVLHADSRQSLRAELRRAEEARDRAPVEAFEQLIAELSEGGLLPESTRQLLVDEGRGLGLSSAQIDRRLGRARFVDDIGRGRIGLDLAGPEWSEIAAKLTTLRRLSDDTVGPTLYAFLGGEVSTPAGHLEALSEKARMRNDMRMRSPAQTAERDVLACVRTHLIEGDPDLYRNAVINNVKNTLRPRVEQRARLHRAMDRVTFSGLVDDAIAQGLDRTWAETAVTELSRAERLKVETPQPPPRQATPPPQRPTPPPQRPTPPPQRPTPPPRRQQMIPAARRPRKSFWLWTLFPWFGIAGVWLYVARKTRDPKYRNIAGTWTTIATVLFVVASLNPGAISAICAIAPLIVHVVFFRGSVIQALAEVREGARR